MGQPAQSDQLFVALAEQLKLPLLQIARLSQQAGDWSAHISVISEHALRLVDAYTRVEQQVTLPLEPLTASAVLYDVAAQLQPFATQHDFVIQLDQQGRGTPVMAHRETLRTMLTLLGASLIEAAAEDETAPGQLVLGSHRSGQGIIIGAFSDHLELSQRVIQLSRQLHGRATQAIPALSMNGGASLAIADKLSSQLAAPLKAYKHRSLSGLGMLLLPSRQLKLVS